MAHVQSVNYTSQSYHTRLNKEVGDWKYPVICPLRKGWFRPYHAQIFVDDYRIPDICVEQFVSDMGYRDPVQFAGREEFKTKLIRFCIRLVRWFGPWDNRKIEQRKAMYRSPVWKYDVLLGVVKDPIQLTQHDGKFKEVL